MIEQATANTGKPGILNTRKSGYLGIGISVLVAPTSTSSLKPGVARADRRRYSAPVTVNPVADLGRSNQSRRTSAPRPLQALFLCPQCVVMAAVRGTPSGVPGTLIPGRPTCVQPSPVLAWPQAVMAPQIKELYPMKQYPALNPSKARAAAHRAMALAALRADSSLSVRFTRYNDHMAKARALEVQEVSL